MFTSPKVIAGLAGISALALLAGCEKPPENMVKVPKGEFTMGSNEVDKEAKALQYGDRRPWYANERPERKVDLKAFHIDRTEVTNRQFHEFVKATGTPAPPHWTGGVYPQGLDEHPVVLVTWAEADGYCKWKGKRLPTEAEWEKAARGTDARKFPWGSDFDTKKVNTLGEYGGTVPVGTLKDGVSPYGAFDMAGNAQEWTADWYKPYPGQRLQRQGIRRALQGSARRRLGRHGPLQPLGLRQDVVQEHRQPSLALRRRRVQVRLALTGLARFFLTGDQGRTTEAKDSERTCE